MQLIIIGLWYSKELLLRNFSLKESGSRYNIGSVSVIGTYLK